MEQFTIWLVGCFAVLATLETSARVDMIAAEQWEFAEENKRINDIAFVNNRFNPSKKEVKINEVNEDLKPLVLFYSIT